MGGMTADVIRLVPETAGEDWTLEAEAVLDGAKGQDLQSCVVFGQDADGELYLAATANAGETMILLERCKHYIVFGHDEG